MPVRLSVDGKGEVVCRCDVPYTVVMHHKRKIHSVAIHIASKYVEDRPAILLFNLVGRQAQFTTNGEQILIGVSEWVHGCQCLDMHFLSLLSVKTLRQEMLQASRYSLNLFPNSIISSELDLPYKSSS